MSDYLANLISFLFLVPQNILNSFHHPWQRSKIFFCWTVLYQSWGVSPITDIGTVSPCQGLPAYSLLVSACTWGIYFSWLEGDLWYQKLLISCSGQYVRLLQGGSPSSCLAIAGLTTQYSKDYSITKLTNRLYCAYNCLILSVTKACLNSLTILFSWISVHFYSKIIKEKSFGIDF